VIVEFDEWDCNPATDTTTQEDYKSLELINVSEQSTQKLNLDAVSHVKIGDSYYQFVGARKVPGFRSDWVVRCNASADRAVV